MKQDSFMLCLGIIMEQKYDITYEFVGKSNYLLLVTPLFLFIALSTF